MPIVELFISLKVPDNVAITAFHTLERMNFKINKLERKDYYKFEFEGNEEEFKNKISDVDILINSNKHNVDFKLENKEVNVLVQDLGEDSKLLKNLKEHFNFKNIKKAEKGVLWTMYLGNKGLAKEITESLLINENYQKYTILR